MRQPFFDEAVSPFHARAQHYSASSVDPVHFKHRLGEIDAYNRNIVPRVLLTTQTDKSAGRVERRPQHQLQTQAPLLA